MKSAGRNSSEPTKPLYARTLGDILVALLVAGIGFYFLMAQSSGDGSATEVVISRSGSQLATFPLGVDRRVDLKQFGVNMVVEIKDGRVHVVSSDCKQQICVRHGWISQSKEAIFCLPNHTTVELTGGQTQYDAISR